MQSILGTALRTRFLREWMGKPFLHANEYVWSRLPNSITATGWMRAYGILMHSLVKEAAMRQQSHLTYFFRNRPELELMRVLSHERPHGSVLRIAVLGCSNGAEVYSIVWRIRLARPDLKVIVKAVDISPEVLDIARSGRYPLRTREKRTEPILERLTEDEMRAIFDVELDHVTVKPWIRGHSQAMD